jgi:TetR/AcrR family transcriptional repressor of nem operon
VLAAAYPVHGPNPASLYIMGTKGDNNRQRIVEAADQLFYTRGYNQTSFRDISDITGIPRGNFYYYFKTKDEILGAVVDSRVAGIKEMLSACEEASSDPRQRVLCFADMLSAAEDSIVQTGCPVGTLSSELAKDEGNFKDIARVVFTLMVNWLTEQFVSMGLGDAKDKAMNLMARMQGITVMACAFNDLDFLRRSFADVKASVNAMVLN